MRVPAGPPIEVDGDSLPRGPDAAAAFAEAIGCLQLLAAAWRRPVVIRWPDGARSWLTPEGWEESPLQRYQRTGRW